MNDSLQTRVIRIEVPGGAIESDSGNHLVDIASVILIVFVLYAGKKAIDKFFRHK